MPLILRPSTPGPVSRWVLRRFGQALTLDVSPTALQLASPTHSVRIPADGGPFGVLFGAGAADDPPYPRLVAALRRAVRDCGITHVKPSVAVRNVASLDAVMSGYQSMILERALLESGAAIVTFEPRRGDAG